MRGIAGQRKPIILVTMTKWQTGHLSLCHPASNENDRGKETGDRREISKKEQLLKYKCLIHRRLQTLSFWQRIKEKINWKDSFLISSIAFENLWNCNSNILIK